MALGASLAGEPSVAAVKAVGRSGDVLVGSFDLSGELPASRSSTATPPSRSTSSSSCRAICPSSSSRMHAEYGLMPGGDVPSGPNLITADKAAR